MRKDTETTKQQVIAVRGDWKSKKSHPSAKLDLKRTHENLFTPVNPKIDRYRIERLIEGESKGRKSNPLTGNVHYVNHIKSACN